MAELWRRQGYQETDIRLLVKQEESRRALKSPLAAQLILDRASVLMDGGCTKLQFLYWHGEGCIAAADHTGRRYVVVGHYVGAEYRMSSIVWEKRKGKPFTWFGNGQASTNAKGYMFHPGECDMAIPGVNHDDITCAINVRHTIQN